MRVKKILNILALIFCISAFFIPLTAYASTGEVQENLKVNAVWLDGEMLQIDVTNNQTGDKQKLELRLKDYTDDSEYVSIQAVDLEGNKSNIVQIKNPYYKPPVNTSSQPVKVEIENTAKSTESAIPSSTIPFTPKGDGTVVDNATDKDGKEFYTIKTPNDNVFHLIIDHQRVGDNVYLLNAVTEDDLTALAQKSNKNGKTASAIPTPTPPIPTEQTTQAPEKQTTPPAKTNNNIGMIVMVVLAVLVTGGVGYYFKIYKPKKQAVDIDDEGEYESESDTEYEEESYPDDEDKEFSDEEYSEFSDEETTEEERK